MTGANLSSEMSLHLDIVLAPTSDIIQHIAVTFLMFKAFCFADKNLTQRRYITPLLEDNLNYPR